MKYFDSGPGIIIYIIIAIALSIFSAIKKKAEAGGETKTTPSNTPEEEPEDPWKELFEKALGEQRQEYIPAKVPTKQEELSEKQIIEAREKIRREEVKIKPVIVPNDTDDFIKNSEITNVKEEESGISDFNIKEAVIYSEILNRKYF